ncbi:uncharacterized protein METZ01_LOCUS162562 [marine metagenome]|uniref:MobA-like NTP transferase domain-containing protein n=1 Tax=marine metagenome TaxID=408172 RepID=A0A382B7I1_9ZZZZ
MAGSRGIDALVIIQARMSSSRLPEKALVELAGKPIIDHVVGRLSEAVGPDRLVLATSDDKSDDILEHHVSRTHGIPVFRGDLENVAQRFQDCLCQFPCKWFVRINGDSPFIDPELVSLMLGAATESDDLVSNVVERTFPKGQSVEVVRSGVFRSTSIESFDSYEREHVTAYFYRHRAKYRIRPVTARGGPVRGRGLAIDTYEDLLDAEMILRDFPDTTRGYAETAIIGSPSS